jgi:hypothetical protein
MPVKEMTVEEMISKFANTNLIPSVNPQISEKTGIKRMLKYRMDDSAKEIDSCPLVREGFIRCYGKTIEPCSDTTLNMLDPLKKFSFFRLKLLGLGVLLFEKSTNGVWKLRDDYIELIYNKENEIFRGYDDLRHLFDEAADKQYSFANMVPVPRGYNGSRNSIGKGSYSDNNDYPYFYYQNLQHRGDSRNISWLNNNMDALFLRASYELVPPFSSPTEYYDERKLDALKKYICSAIRVIDERARWIAEGHKECRN